jgi:Protein of unknown function (DUF3263)
VENYAQLRGAPTAASPPKPSQLRGAPNAASPPEPMRAREQETVAHGPLGERERKVLAFERHWWRHAGAKEEAIRREFGLGPTAYYQLLSRLLDDPAALAHDPMLVKRLQRQRASRRRQRAGRRLTPYSSDGS